MLPLIVRPAIMELPGFGAKAPLMLFRILIALRFITAVIAQTPPAAESNSDTRGSHGAIMDSLTGTPVEGVAVILTDSRQVTKTDATGKFRFDDLPPGRHMILAIARTHYEIRRAVNLQPGQNINNLVFRLPPSASIKGKVLDDNRRPIPGATVTLLGKQYHFGALRTFIKEWVTTNGLGKYAFRTAIPAAPTGFVPRFLPVT